MRTHAPVLLLGLLSALARAQEETALPAPASWLAIGPVDQRGRQPFNPDGVFARYLLDPSSAPPREGERVEGTGGRSDSWRRVEADANGHVGGSIAYAYTALRLEQAGVVLARLENGATLWVNGTAYVGDIYGSGSPGVPAPLVAGTNHLFVRGVRGAFRLELRPAPPGPAWTARDATLPDLVTGEPLAADGSVVVFNAGPEPVPSLLLGSRVPGEKRVALSTWRGAPEGLAPWAVRRLAFGLELGAESAAGSVRREIVGLPGACGSVPVELAVRAPEDARRVTFRSGIDGSVQFYGLRSPAGEPDPVADGVVLTLHGAGVDARNQAASYSARPGLWIVAPTNRRPFGFDWQDWGRRDAYEVLAHTLRAHGGDPARVYLTGHSMGGHGAWHLAANDPDRWLAVAPSAGWATFDTYVGRPDSALGKLWRGADASSDTLALLGNLVPLPLYVLHGGNDDNVPVREALLMEALLLEAGGAPIVHVQPGAGHWWDGDAAPGADCVDWPPMFGFFGRHWPPPAGHDPASFTWTSVDPGVDAEHRFLTFLQPLRYGEPAHFVVRREGDTLRIDTTNVRRFTAAPNPPPLRTIVDGAEFSPAARASFLRTDDGWTRAEPVAGEKGPARGGPFKRAFDRRFVLVVGEHDGAGMDRARYDAQVWWYRANGDAPIVTDRAFLAEPERFAGRNVILYGNEGINRAWDRVLGRAVPLSVSPGSLRHAETGRPGSAPLAHFPGHIRLGEREWTGDALAAVFVSPRADDDSALAGAFAYTSAAGARLGYALLPFVSGVGYPDYAIFDARILTEGDGGVLAAGWFDHAWTLQD